MAATIMYGGGDGGDGEHETSSNSVSGALEGPILRCFARRARIWQREPRQSSFGVRSGRLFGLSAE
eukprot:6492456-Alexandrium_andersonii.AAC.1